jgi:flagellar hook-length control protein FliK
MNANPMTLNSANAVQPSSAGKQQEAATPDVPFSQVLTSEIAQNRANSQAKEPTNTKAGSEAASQPAGSTKDGTGAPDKTAATEQSKGDAQTEDPTQVTPDALLALAIQPDLMKPVPVDVKGVPAEEPAAVGADTSNPLDVRKGRSQRTVQAGQFDEAAGTKKADPTLTGKVDLQTAATAATPSPATANAAAFSEQLAAARQSDSTKTREALSELMSNPLMRTAPHAPLDTPPTLAGAATDKLAPSVGTTAWGQALGEKIVWMAAGAQQSASLTLNPPNLGPLQIVLHVSNDQATASFFSAQPEVRQALESAFPRLREMMNEAGIQLGQTMVSADTPQQNDASGQQAQRGALPFSGSNDPAVDGVSTAHLPLQQSGRGLVDTFA